ncbi:lipid-binding protein [Thalassobellus suaedae]|uniref:Lipid-binding protein n=1 Tax=Thalassobellus suaedae TaxID=3074124 RepID=A0ABY9Y574_9FLAO|nr:lipid-binding protein [Flavobacteriaceae bacterium HL-DH10]
MDTIKKYIVLVLIGIIAFTSCETEEGYEDYTVENTNLSDMSGDWYVEVFVDDDLVSDYIRITTSNSASSENSLQIYDHFNFWWMNVAVPADLSSLTFSGTDLLSSVEDDDTDTTDVFETYDVNVNVSNGSVIKDGTVTSGTGNVADLISFDVEFADDPGTIYHFEGYKRSGFLEDEH